MFVSFNGSGFQEQFVAELYEIHLRGHLDADWSNWLGNLSVTHTTDGMTVLFGEVVDQTALHGLLIRIHDLNIPLLFVSRYPDYPDQPDPPNNLTQGERS